VQADFARDLDAAAWLPRLASVDAVINAVGIFREHGEQTFQALHVEAPIALFDACVQAKVARVIQISALGADAQARSAYHLSKRRADRHLATLPLDWTVAQPSLVFGRSGTSASFFLALASLPVIPLPGRGDQQVQPVHIDDVTEALANLLDTPAAFRSVVPFVGSRPLSLRKYIAELRGALGYGVGRYLPVPKVLVRSAARAGRIFRGSLLTEDSLAMLMRGNVADGRPVQDLLGRAPRSPAQFLAAEEVRSARLDAQLFWLLPLLRTSIALVWIVTGIVSLGLYPTEASFGLLARSGVPETLRPLFLYGAATLDLLLGLATLFAPRRRLLWLGQIALIVGYTAIITVRMPEFWLHPYGPLLKNLPMLAGIYLLYRLERD
jgi:uncharacterized protein YbjT (DUF2867 family)